MSIGGPSVGLPGSSLFLQSPLLVNMARYINQPGYTTSHPAYERMKKHYQEQAYLSNKGIVGSVKVYLKQELKTKEVSVMVSKHFCV